MIFVQAFKPHKICNVRPNTTQFCTNMIVKVVPQLCGREFLQNLAVVAVTLALGPILGHFRVNLG